MKTIDLQIHIDADQATKRMEKAHCAALALKKALDDLKEIDINVNVVRKETKRWYQFWK